MSGREIDMASYPRRAHFDYFRSLAYPYFGVTVDVDVTALKAACREKGLSFYLAFMHAAALAADGVPQLRQRIRRGGIVEYESCPASHIELLPDEIYRYCTLYHTMSTAEYFAAAEKAREQCLEGRELEEEADAEGMYFVSTLPWLSYSSFRSAHSRRGRLQSPHNMGQIPGGKGQTGNAADHSGSPCSCRRRSCPKILRKCGRETEKTGRRDTKTVTKTRQRRNMLCRAVAS